MTLQSRNQPQIVQNAGAQFHRHAVDPLQRLGHHPFEFVESELDLGYVLRGSQCPEADQDGGKGLTRFIVQLTGNPLALFFLSRDDFFQQSPPHGLFSLHLLQ